MFPIRDDNPRLRYPVVTVALIAINVAVFVYQFALGVSSPPAAEALVFEFGTIPARISESLIGRYPLGDAFFPLLTSIFLHGGLMHLASNMWFLWVFGDNIEDELGRVPFVGFYVLCGLVASFAHIVANPLSNIPAIGASGAIAGVMGAYIIRFPMARILTVIPILIFPWFVEIPAFLMLAYWFVIQFFSGAMSFGAVEGGGVAWWAHVGGFVAGAALIWSRPKRRRYRQAFFRY